MFLSFKIYYQSNFTCLQIYIVNFQSSLFFYQNLIIAKLVLVRLK